MSGLGVCPQFANSGTCTYGAGCQFQHIDRPEVRNPTGANFSTFFANYAGFRYNPGNSAILEFYRLCDFNHWDRDDPERERAHKAFKDALVKEFNDIYGTDEKDINSWHKICTVVNIDPLPDTLRKARDAVLSKHINLVDLVDHPTGRVRVYDSLEGLRTYTIATGKYFPRGNAYAGGLLKYLLREIHSEYQGNRRPGGNRRRRRNP
ncbi:hypothetical protein PC9H_009911 [Pleurotus ostreatus]|uniref:C3H1-type domain-containing protein n=2 Tax=Pleurotus ostreatus TaxID=5322 RepID=A0A067NA07_PLEO1|nr:uncharacterized protein PC9H_009911 [Pleurotus ostreatus]KAF7424603.1 hypothetical protein PC9H_009911 [Pleurotus ostreatus]KAJ8692427.1 hypothetical protein PTI98_009739 [Pleurotus ostreatus]KDQ24828.1 hypothetical protein PLEOSDRAFT_1107755 [Pleurotus ostreatus PC15]